MNSSSLQTDLTSKLSHISEEMKSEPDVLTAFFEYLTGKIQYCIVGDVRNLPADTSKDIDFVIEDEDRVKIPRLLLEFCRVNGCRLIQCLRHESIAAYYVICWPGDHNEMRVLQLDFCSDYLRYARPLLIAEELLAGVCPVSSKTAGLELPVPPPRKAFIYYLLKRVDKKQLTLDNGAYLSGQYALDPSGCREEILRFWPESDVEELAVATVGNQWDPIIKMVERYQQDIQTESIRKARMSAPELFRIIERIFHPTGLILEIEGLPEGLKNSFSSECQTLLLRGFRSTICDKTLSRRRVWWKTVRSALVVADGSRRYPFVQRLTVRFINAEPSESEVVRVGARTCAFRRRFSDFDDPVVLKHSCMQIADFVTEYLEKRLLKRMRKVL